MALFRKSNPKEVATGTVTFDGFIQRTQGPTSYWINRQMQSDGTNLSLGFHAIPGKTKERIRIERTNKEGHIVLEAGQKLDERSGLVLEPYQTSLAQQEAYQKRQEEKRQQALAAKKTQETQKAKGEENVLNQVESLINTSPKNGQ
ncbi:MAG: hypothetical protein H7832_12225 [Magnetococcus sp. DMHC-6]